MVVSEGYELNMDAAEVAKYFEYHPKCKKVILTHLWFADDLMVFVEGTKQFT